MASKKAGVLFALVLACSLFCIINGLWMTMRVINQYEEIAITAQDDQLFGLARSVDRSVSSYLSRFRGNLEYTVSHRGFAFAEAAYLAGGAADDLLARMTDNIVLRDELIVTMLATRSPQEVLLSSNGQVSYTFPTTAGWQDESSAIRPCLAEDGTVYLAFGMVGEGGLTYYALMDLVAFYRRVADDLTVDTGDHILLMDAGGRAMVHNTHDGVRVHVVEAMTRNDCDYDSLPHMLATQAQRSEQAVFYNAHTCKGDGPFTSRMVTLPATAETNGFFVVGATTNYDESMRPLSVAALRLISYGSKAVFGIFMLAALAMWLARRGARADKELAHLREKNAVMEELTRKTEALAHHQRLQTIGTLTASIAHEFNNLLTPIMGYSLMAMEQLPQAEGELYDDLLEIYQASHKAKEIISRLSDLSRKNTARTFRFVPPNRLVAKVLEVAQPVRPPHVQVVTALACPEVGVIGNELQLSQLLLNLILNAYHAMDEQGGQLTVSTYHAGGRVYFRVADTGCGITPEVLPQIFDPFFSTKETGKGTGLGLAIVRQVVEEHKGELTVDSAVGVGSVFTAAFPAAPAEDPAQIWED